MERESFMYAIPLRFCLQGWIAGLVWGVAMQFICAAA